MTMLPSEEETIRNQIAELRAKLPPLPREPAEPLHAVVTKVFRDGGNHTRTVDLANDWKRVGHGIRDTVKQGGEVTLRPLYTGEGVQEHKEYPSTKRIKALEVLVDRVARLDPGAGEIGPGMLVQLVEAARELMAGQVAP
jgi:pyruvate/oxaloacetate carboxyltransferase